MLTQGNHKLGGRLIWSFSLPSARPDICIGMSDLCRQHCYARRLEKLRPAVLARYEANYQLSLAPDFARRVRAFLVAARRRRGPPARRRRFLLPDYARKWLRVMRRSPGVRFYFYTRAWRDGAMRTDPRAHGGLAQLPCLVLVRPRDRASLPSSRRASDWPGWPSPRTTCRPPLPSLVFRVRGLRSPAGHAPERRARLPGRRRRAAQPAGHLRTLLSCAGSRCPRPPRGG